MAALIYIVLVTDKIDYWYRQVCALVFRISA